MMTLPGQRRTVSKWNITRYSAIQETKPVPRMNPVFLTTRILIQNRAFKRLKRAFETHKMIHIKELERLSRNVG